MTAYILIVKAKEFVDFTIIFCFIQHFVITLQCYNININKKHQE